MSSMSNPGTKPTLEEEKRKELVLQCLRECGVSKYDADVVDTLSRWIAQESKGASQDKRSELSAKGLTPDVVSKLILESTGIRK
jgi:hypothetical protein